MVFKAVQSDNPDQVLSELNGLSGVCNHVRTSKTSLQCGLATTLMEFCFTDDDIGSLSNHMISGIGNIEHSKKIVHHCEHVIYLSCAPERPETPTVACSAYLTAAVNTDHKIVFTTSKEKGGVDVMNVEKDAKPKFRRNPDMFISSHGENWYFCRCKPETIAECEALTL